jgi:hypothetical protein
MVSFLVVGLASCLAWSRLARAMLALVRSTIFLYDYILDVGV